MNKILFISHDASRTGAPLLLLNLLRWIKNNTQLNFDILLLSGGELEVEFEKLGKVYKPNTKPVSLRKQIVDRLLRKLNLLTENKKFRIYFNNEKTEDYSVIYGNTIVSISVFEQLFNKFPNAYFILHVHELYSITRNFTQIMEKVKAIPVKYIAVSELVKKNLIEKHHITSLISIIYEYVDIEFIKSNSINSLYNTCNKFVVNGSGLVQPRKGYDIFIIIAQRAVKKYSNIPFYFKWIGEIPQGIKPYIEIDIVNSGLTNFIEFTGSLGKPFPIYAGADIFLLTSREDPFPIVCLEHACLGIPIICFEHATGITEFVENDCGIIIPYLDIEKAVDELARMYYDSEKRKEYGTNAKTKVQQYDINIQIPKILAIINNA